MRKNKMVPVRTWIAEVVFYRRPCGAAEGVGKPSSKKGMGYGDLPRSRCTHSTLTANNMGVC